MPKTVRVGLAHQSGPIFQLFEHLAKPLTVNCSPFL
jgi:hypothetical protein